MKKKYYIGLSTSPHDPSLAIVDDQGEVIFAEDSERYLQNKRAWCSPADDFIRIGKILKEYCSENAEFVIATSWRQKFFKRLQFFAFGPLKFLIKKKIGPENFTLLKCIAAYANFRHGVNTECQITRIFGQDTVIHRREYDHHLTHSAAACFSSGFKDAVSVVVDGLGENTSLKLYAYENGRHRELTRRGSEGSLGQYYSFVCELCGFDPLAGEEWKVMGLAPYGTTDKRYHALLSQLIDVDGLRLKEGKNAAQATQQLKQLARRKDEPALAYKDLAHTGQQVFSETLNKLLENLSQIEQSKNIVLSGGCALNSAYVGCMLKESAYKNSYVFCAPADNGNSVGAALLAYQQDNPDWKPKKTKQHPYLGSRMEQKKIDYVLKFSGLKPVEIQTEDQLFDYVANRISQQKIIGWVQGRAEFGPRALGNRSILADPRNEHVKAMINDKVKFREEFRPFAPSILAEHGNDFFENYCDTPYMERALTFKKEKMHLVPGVVHVDGTGRLQSVSKEFNSRYYGLINRFYEITGVPILLNTSFNVMGKPIVHSVEDALSVFFTSGIDILVIENYVFEKEMINIDSSTESTANNQIKRDESLAV